MTSDIAGAAPEPLFAAACAGCGAGYPVSGFPAVCPACGGFFLHTAAFAWRPALPGCAFGPRRWAPALGLQSDEVPERAFGVSPTLYGGPGTPVWICQQGSAPTGSHKERGAEVMAAAARRRGLGEMFLDSSGNAGIAVARAAAARGIACHVLVPRTTPEIKLARIRSAGAKLVVIDGDRDATHRTAQEWRRRMPYAAPFLQPSFIAGMATLAWDLDASFAALGRSLPGHWFLPAGNGPLLLGLFLGFECLRRAGRLHLLPTLHVAQLDGYAALADGGPGRRSAAAPVAAGIAIGDPPRRSDLLQCLRASEGDVTVVSEEEIAAAQRELADGGWATDLTGAAAFAAYRKSADLAGTGESAPNCAVILTSREAAAAPAASIR